MYAISFRIPIATIAGQKVFINGSALFHRALKSGTKISVRSASDPSSTGLSAEVILSQGSKRDVESFQWDIINAG